MSELRVAVAMGGGVSLGSFCGGALGEAVRQLLENRAEAYEDVRFDVFSGASAGAMSLGLLAHTLAHPDFAGEADAALRRQRDAWVRRIDIRELIPDPKTERISALLDRGAVDRIAGALLAWDDGTPPRTDVLGPRVLLACTLANLNGIPIDGRRAGQGDEFLDALQTTLHEDLRVFDLRLDDDGGAPGRAGWVVRDQASRPEVWREVAATCVAAGAFPLAFEPVALERAREEYGSLWPDAWSELDAFPFTFSDGGMFNNEPLREVMNLIHHVDAEPGDFERVVIFIDPNLSGTHEDLSLDYYREIEVRDPDNTLWKLGRLFDGLDVAPRSYVDRMTALVAPLLGALRGQAAFKDWLAAEKVNNRLEWRDALRTTLFELLERIPDDALGDGGTTGGFRREVRARLRGVLEAKGGRSVRENPELALDRERARIEREEADRLGTLPDGKRQTAVHLLSLLDQVAGLRGRMQVQVVGIGPIDDAGEPLDLAGDHVANFGGFFRESHRAHDFDVGRERAGRLLARSGLLRDGRRVPRRPQPAVPSEGGGTPAGTERLLERMKQVAGDLLDIRIDWPLKLDELAVRLARGKLGRLVAGALDGDGPPRARYVVRLEVVPEEADDRFKLGGHGGGDPLDAVDVEEVAVLETLVFHRPGNRLKGPHVARRSGRDVLEVIRDVRFRRDERGFVALPDDAAFTTVERMGYGKLVARVPWSELAARGGRVLRPGRWKAVETLLGWEGG